MSMLSTGLRKLAAGFIGTRHFSSKGKDYFRDYVIRATVPKDCKRIVTQKYKIFESVLPDAPNHLSKAETDKRVKELKIQIKSRTYLSNVAATKNTEKDTFYGKACGSAAVELNDTSEVNKFKILDKMVT